MAAKKNIEAVEEKTETVGKSAVAKGKEAKEEPKFTVEKLREKCMALYGVSQSTFDGAMCGHTEAEYTIKEAEGIIDVWLHGKEGKN